MVRQEVLKLYRDILRAIRQIEKKEDRLYMNNWVKDDFRANKNIKDNVSQKVTNISCKKFF